MWTQAQWRIAVTAYAQLRDQVRTADRECLWEYELPSLPATEREISACETALRSRLHPEFRAFLNVAGGWHTFWHAADLFGPADLLSSESLDRAMSILHLFRGSSKDLSATNFVPIGVSHFDSDVFLLARDTAENYGQVVWLTAEEEIDRFSGFQEFFASIIKYAKRDLVDFSSRPDPE